MPPKLTHAEQNRLILDHIPMVEPIAGLHRGKKNVPFEDLCSAGALGLTKAARKWEQKSDFKAFAYRLIEGEIFDLLRAWEPVEAIGLLNTEEDEKFYEWAQYRTAYESWEKLAASPEELRILWEELRDTRNALSGALIGLSKRDRAILEARFLRNPPQKLESIAREHKISYARVVFLIDRSLKRLKKILQAQEDNRIFDECLASLQHKPSL